MVQLLRYFHTIRHLRRRQLWYRLWRPLQKRFYKKKAAPDAAIEAALAWPEMSLHSFEPHDIFDPSAQTFSFLNLTANYSAGINWNEGRHGLLWAFHLNYFGWLEDECLPVADRLKTILDYTAAEDTIAVGRSCYTISLRSLSWIRFFLKHRPDKAAVGLLYKHLARLHRFPEYELDGNHLWENGCALFAGGLYFKDAAFYSKGLKILKEVIRDQLAPDGMHLEASPMYHSLLLQRLFMCIELWEKMQPDHEENFLKEAAAKMLGWLNGFAFEDGTWAMVNDAAAGIAPSKEMLKHYAAEIGVASEPQKQQSHYRHFKNDFFELIADVGNIAPCWQPGHHHADALSFCLNAAGNPVIVDAGVSTYEPSVLRQAQRSTGAHNTIAVSETDSSDVWKSFRIGRRALMSILNDTPTEIRASHNGYRSFGLTHIRRILFGADKIIIEDQLMGRKRRQAVLHLHFHPDIVIKKIGESQYLARNLLISFKNAVSFEPETYTFAEGFNRTREATRLVIEVTAYTTTTIERINTTNAD